MEKLFTTIRKYNLKLNPDKCLSGVEAVKFLGFLLTRRGIEANPDKCAVIIGMRSSTNVKEVQQLTGRMAALSRFLSVSGDRGILIYNASRRTIVLYGPMNVRKPSPS